MSVTSRLGFYYGHPAPYAGEYIMRQAKVVSPDMFITIEPSSSVPGNHISTGYKLQAARIASRKLTGLGRRFKLFQGREPIQMARIHRAVQGLRAIYTLSLDNAMDLLPLSDKTPKLIVHAAGSDVTALQSRHPSIQRALLEVLHSSFLVLCGSKFIQDRVFSLSPDCNSMVHYIGIEIPQEPRNNTEVEGSNFTVLAVSRLHPVKGIRYSLEAFSEAFKGEASASFRIAGGGPEDVSLRHLADELGIHDQVKFLGRLTVSQVYSEMRSATVFVQHNVELGSGAAEALGGSILEASAHELPVVATNSGGVPEAVVHGETGILVSERDVGATAQALRRLHGDPQLRMRLGSSGRRFVSQVHNSVVQDARLSEILRSI